jgi:hypothetical protein
MVRFFSETNFAGLRGPPLGYNAAASKRASAASKMLKRADDVSEKATRPHIECERVKELSGKA